jgi:hypothetical protein
MSYVRYKGVHLPKTNTVEGLLDCLANVMRANGFPPEDIVTAVFHAKRDLDET